MATQAPRLRPGDTLAVISPAGHTDSPDAFERGLALLEAEGFRVRLMPNARSRHPQLHYLGGTDEERLADLHTAFADPAIKGILAARGGYGCMRLLPKINWELIRRHPKVLMGFSDLTALLIPAYQRTGLVGFYGPMLTSNLVHGELFSQEQLFRMVRGENTIPFIVPNRDFYTCLKPGTAEGPLIGGNLSLLAALCGTPEQPRTDGHILFIEDWKERHYSLDRQIQQLKLAGLFDNIRGLLFCDFSEIDPEPGCSLTELLASLSTDLNVPVGYGFSVGHGEQTATLPIGAQARFEASEGRLLLLESPVQ